MSYRGGRDRSPPSRSDREKVDEFGRPVRAREEYRRDDRHGDRNDGGRKRNRSRSRSRSRERDKDRDRGNDADAFLNSLDRPPPPPPSRGGSNPVEKRDVPPSPPGKTKQNVPPPPLHTEVPPPPPPAGHDDAEAQMMALMGFGGFVTTQGKHVEDKNANISAVRKKTTRRARQYMNREGGFNRPLPEEKTGIRQNKI